MPYGRTRTPIGQRRERVRLQRLPTVDDGMGGQEPATLNNWIDVAQPWVCVTALDERTHEAIEGNQLTAQHAYHVDMRYQSGVVPTMRLLWREKVLSIQTVADDEMRQRRLILLCGEVQA